MTNSATEENPAMSKSVEATGRTVEEAKRAAANALGVSVEECEFEILEHGSKGLFAKDNVRVRAAISERAAVEAPPAKGEVEDLDSEPADTDFEADLEEEEAGYAIEATEDDAVIVREMLEGIFDASGLKIKVEVASISGKYVNIALSGPDVSYLLTSRTPAIDSLQYLANAMLSRVLPGGVRVTLDARKYREQRAAALVKEAKMIAAEVVRLKQEAVLDPLPAHERRVIHQALADFDGVETYSEGEEPQRRVVITPKRS